VPTFFPVPSPASICLLDDEPSVLKAIGRLLASEDLPVEPFTEPERFLAFAQGHPVRLAIIDVRMPGMTGLDVLSRLRAAMPQVRVIIITAEDDGGNREAALSGGAVAFFLKPFDNDAFVAAVRAAVAEPA
jgi:FixJ family two-component response regulator